jgi:hypothetical protein
MHSFHPSRGRILFEFACALGIVASLVGAWKQTGASAMLVAASVAGLYGFVRLLDMRHARPAEAVEPQRIDFAKDDPGGLVANLHALESVAMVMEEPAVPPVVLGAEPAELVATLVELAAAPAKTTRKTKAPRKAKTNRATATVELDVPDAEPQGEGEVVAFSEPEFPRIEPLFEPEPFVRQPRAVVFGRKAG